MIRRSRLNYFKDRVRFANGIISFSVWIGSGNLKLALEVMIAIILATWVVQGLLWEAHLLKED